MRRRIGEGELSGPGSLLFVIAAAAMISCTTDYSGVSKTGGATGAGPTGGVDDWPPDTTTTMARRSPGGAPPLGAPESDAAVATISVPDAGASPPDAPAPTATEASAPPAAPPDAAASVATAPRVLRLHDVQAKRLKVGAIYAHSIEAKGGTVGARFAPVPDATLMAEMGDMDMKGADEITSDLLYAHDVKADIIDAQEVHATSVKIGP